MPQSQPSQPRNHRIQKQSPAFWKAHVQAWKDSGLKRAEYCRRQRLSYDALTYWYAKTKNADSQTASSSIVPVLTIQPVEPPVQSPIRIRCGKQFTIELDGEFDETVLRKVIRVLEG